jgi:DNA polymerase-3 subunit beta
MTTDITPKIAVSTAMLRAALLCANNEPVRPYLNGVRVDASGKLVSTDGHRMFVGAIDLAASDVEPGSFEGWTICRDALKRALTGYKQDTIEISPARIGDLSCQPLDDSFPDWTRVLPSEPTGEIAQFNPRYIADMGKIGTLLIGSKSGLTAHIHHNGNGPAGVTFPGAGDAYGVLMPIRASHSLQDWKDARA